ncbi:unnamed protein product (macronuclear) [Paramecium tetraurelia]|uniref:HTH myb-type domain-containing protein n=1 Tax=Paramecium tetraurelia TaxID=5888 RepID=A0BPT6_PARTE|nr:uncharacterized protein GSPATT00005303001 [Paramecium tetraurelia]CAK60553.1 unnamed protein product [Paramecium tetraurelia]|eukprot:XP_001427951.1 hypothetical protein (macronuclear) [Paramecium tetraurelia strain d4-2]
MLTQVKITKRNSKAIKTKKDKDQGRNKNVILQQEFHHPVNSNSEIFMSDHESLTSNNEEPNKVCDITENADNVYSQQFLKHKDNQANKNLKQEKMKQIRYSLKKDNEIRHKRSKNRVKTFSKEDDQRLLNYVLKKGPKFHKFSRYFPGKTSNMLKNRYYKQLRFVWDNILGKYNVKYFRQYHPVDCISKDQLPKIENEADQIKIETIEELQLFPEAECVLSKFLGCLSTTFINIHTQFL